MISNCNNKINALIADFHFYLISKSEFLKLNRFTIDKFKIQSSDCIDFTINYNLTDSYSVLGWNIAFKGEPCVNEYLNYAWRVYIKKEKVAIEVDFNDHEEIEKIWAEISSDSSVVTVNVIPKNINKYIVIDPFIHPMGSLLMLYLLRSKKGLLIHSSAILNNNNVFLFTGVSGIGKSTMAKLWSDSGHVVLNDDRVILRVVNDEIVAYTGPMPYYQQASIKGKLTKIFLLKQSESNYIEPLSGVIAYTRVLSNFIQQFYHKKMVHEHLSLVEEVIKGTNVYEVGFKPNRDIVDMIKLLSNNEG